MTERIAYHNFINQQIRIAAGCRFMVCTFMLSLFSYVSCFADRKEISGYAEADYGVDAGTSGYDETSVFINVQRVGGIDMPALIHGSTVYLSITDVFDFLKIKCKIDYQ